jgi:hypothetical protein
LEKKEIKGYMPLVEHYRKAFVIGRIFARWRYFSAAVSSVGNLSGGAGGGAAAALCKNRKKSLGNQ